VGWNREGAARGEGSSVGGMESNRVDFFFVEDIQGGERGEWRGGEVGSRPKEGRFEQESVR